MYKQYATSIRDLKQRKLDLYTSDKCIICKKETENVEHLASCEVSINLVREIEEQEVESTLIEFKETVNVREMKEWILAMMGKGSLVEE